MRRFFKAVVNTVADLFVRGWRSHPTADVQACRRHAGHVVDGMSRYARGGSIHLVRCDRCGKEWKKVIEI